MTSNNQKKPDKARQNQSKQGKASQSKSNPIVAWQRKKIFAVGRNLGLDIDALRDVAMSISGRASISKLTWTQANSVINRLENRVTRARARERAGAENVTPMITQRQKGKIWKLACLLGWDKDTQRLYGFYERQIGKRKPSSSEEATKIITGMEKLIGEGY